MKAGQRAAGRRVVLEARYLGQEGEMGLLDRLELLSAPLKSLAKVSERYADIPRGFIMNAFQKPGHSWYNPSKRCSSENETRVVQSLKMRICHIVDTNDCKILAGNFH